jgi:hypothetical protein
VCDKLRILKIGKKVNKWVTPHIMGNAPEGRYGHCMDYFPDIGILAIYGGRNDDLYKQTGTSCFEDIYILNLIETLSWSKVNVTGNYPPTRYCFASCKIKNNFIIFGGLSDNNFCNSDVHYLLLDQNDVKKHKDDIPSKVYIEPTSQLVPQQKQDQTPNKSAMPAVIVEDNKEEDS